MASRRSGILNVWLMPIVGPGFFNIYTVWGIGFVLGLYYSPYVYFFTLANLQAMDASLEEASRTSGDSTLHTTFNITLPLSSPAILSSSLLFFLSSIGFFSFTL